MARLSRTFLHSLSAADLTEPLLSLDETQPASAALLLMREKHVDVLGVRQAGLVTGWVTSGDLGGNRLAECTRQFEPDNVFDESASLATILGALATREQVFIKWLGEIAGVITRRELQKPSVRMWLFGAITVLDANMTGAIEELYPGDSWQHLMSEGRVEKALALQKKRNRRKSPCRLVDCLQVGDKIAILTSEDAHIAALGLPSRKEAKRLRSAIDDLRNHLAHAQVFEGRHLFSAAWLAGIIDSIVRAEGVQRILATHAAAAPSPDL